MALVPSTLQSALTRLFRRPPINSNDVARQTASAYASYAATASAGLGLPTFTGLEEGSFAAAFRFATIKPKLGAPSRYAEAWALSVLGFWTLPPVLFFIPPAPAPPVDTGVPAPAPGADVIFKASLISVVSNLGNSPEAAAAGIAAAVDVYTRTFLVTYAPSATVFPIS
jgi:hypothetical protein